MEKITIERLTTDLVGVIAKIKEIVAKKDIVSARTVLSQVAELIANENEVPLDKDVSDGKFDHVLHELLTKIICIILIFFILMSIITLIIGVIEYYLKSRK